MSARPQDWSPLLEDRDPVPGDPAAVQVAVSHYRQVVDGIRSAARNLAAVATASDDSSDAMTAFRERVGTVHSDLRKIESRYQGLADALAGYAPRLASAQEVSVSALAAAREAQHRAWAAENAERNADDQLRASGDPAQQQELATQVVLARRASEDAAANLAAARAQLHGAVASRDAAAAVAIAVIEDTEAASTVNDSVWDRIVDTVGDIAVVLGKWFEAIADILDKLSAVLAVLQVVLIVVSFFVPAVGVLVLLTKVLKIITVVGKIAKAVTVVRNVLRVVRVIAGREKVTWRGLLGEAIKVGAGALIGGVADRIGQAASDGILKQAQGVLMNSEQMRFVRAGLTDPAGRARAWGDQVFPDDSYGELLDLAGRSTERGRQAIADAVFDNWVVDHVVDEAADAVQGGVDALVDAAVDGPRRSSDVSGSGGW
ncbi:hypothetical protein [Actinotalea fermentans]|uniref:Uncharacterized protein n=1 Tax=Actinotalea fermentans TaxID=43671 RepID=A0A511YZ60_9CELL|nr:hypothetical protein [Actinotalea fermentans]KGM15731.1 hypothetical protein N867_06035 [Actinotalea fermentans ATCC 43279 = JCM 9966 = DSM 3133]GEN80485.1 hypothetical protein AFE02nite_22190 [Actinotalea fermentans]